ncbi:MAG: UbiA family prenyltransferase, partial [Candidatus Diapherotrites archaeon]|nr:UbiA family prenyltransferase [Candidatus Diapherotrites archaeon]
MPSKRISHKNAFVFAILLFFLGGIFSYLVNSTAFAITILFGILLFIYSWKLPYYKYFGNFIVALSTGFALIFGASFSGNFFVISLLALSAFFANLARELIKDTEDIKGDKGGKISLPQILSLEKVNLLVLLYSILAIIVSYLPPILVIVFGFSEFAKFSTIRYFILITIANAVIVRSQMLNYKKEYKKAQ